MQKITKNKVVEVFLEFHDSQGVKLDNEQFSYLHGGYGDLLPKIEQELDNKTVGFEVKLYLEPEDAFGDYDADLLRLEPRADFPEAIEVGMVFEGVPSNKSEEAAERDEHYFFVVQQITETHVLLDGNPRFAGISIQVYCRVENIRAANPNEIEQGYADSDDEAPLLHVLPSKKTFH